MRKSILQFLNNDGEGRLFKLECMYKYSNYLTHASEGRINYIARTSSFSTVGMPSTKTWQGMGISDPSARLADIT
jgi:hypothetical protein